MKGVKDMNIFNMTDEEFEKYLQDNIDNIPPAILLDELIKCGLTTEEVDEEIAF